MRTAFEVLEEIEAADDLGQHLELLDSGVTLSQQLLVLCLADGAMDTLNRLAKSLTAVSAAPKVVQQLANSSVRERIAVLAANGKLALRLWENLAPREKADTKLGRSPIARKILAVLTQYDTLRAPQLREVIGVENQSNLNRVVRKLAQAGYLTLDRSEDGLPWYGITLRGRAVTQQIISQSPEVVDTDPESDNTPPDYEGVASPNSPQVAPREVPVEPFTSITPEKREQSAAAQRVIEEVGNLWAANKAA